MCGRTACCLSVKELEETLQVPLCKKKNYKDQFKPSFNVAPNRYQPVLLQERSTEAKTSDSNLFKGADFPSNVTLVFMKWNLPFSKNQTSKTAKSSTRPFVLHNVRAESLVGPMAKSSLNRFKRQYHCVIIANGYYEWQQQGPDGARKVPYYFRRDDGNLCYFAGLYGSPSGGSRGDDAGYCLITTEAPEGAIREIHDRMPLQFTSTEDMMLWLEEAHNSWTNAHENLLERTFTGRGREGLATTFFRAPELEYFQMDPIIAEKERQIRRDNLIDFEAINHENNFTKVATRPSEDLKDFFRIRKLPKHEKNEGL